MKMLMEGIMKKRIAGICAALALTAFVGCGTTSTVKGSGLKGKAPKMNPGKTVIIVRPILASAPIAAKLLPTTRRSARIVHRTSKAKKHSSPSAMATTLISSASGPTWLMSRPKSQAHCHALLQKQFRQA